jgi:prepilin peptidase CpaA
MLLVILRSIVCILLVVLAYSDTRDRRLPNLTVAIVALFYVACAVIQKDSFTTISIHLGTGLLVLAAGIAMFARRWFGGGDAKLAAAVFVWTGTGLAWPTLLLISLLGLFVALISMAANRLSRNQESGLFYRLSSRRGVPYGIALSGGGCFAVLLPAFVNLPRF